MSSVSSSSDRPFHDATTTADTSPMGTPPMKGNRSFVEGPFSGASGGLQAGGIRGSRFLGSVIRLKPSNELTVAEINRISRFMRGQVIRDIGPSRFLGTVIKVKPPNLLTNVEIDRISRFNRGQIIETQSLGESDVGHPVRDKITGSLRRSRFVGKVIQVKTPDELTRAEMIRISRFQQGLAIADQTQRQGIVPVRQVHPASKPWPSGQFEAGAKMPPARTRRLQC